MTEFETIYLLNEQERFRILFPEYYKFQTFPPFSSSIKNFIEKELKACIIEHNFHKSFSFYLVGSILSKKKFIRDVDIVFYKKSQKKTSVKEISNIMVTLRLFGLQELGLLLDTFFRTSSEQKILNNFESGADFYTWMLSHPYPQVFGGEFLVKKKFKIVEVISRKNTTTSYFEKLPQLNGVHYLRPGKKII